MAHDSRLITRPVMQFSIPQSLIAMAVYYYDMNCAHEHLITLANLYILMKFHRGLISIAHIRTLRIADVTLKSKTEPRWVTSIILSNFRVIYRKIQG